jgi:hypothetical protein
MKTGKILDNVGFRKLDGTTRQLTITEQLIRNKQFVGINDIKHPLHGIVNVDRYRLDELLQHSEDELLQMTKEKFSNDNV